jgi:hypothetical protein
MSVLLRSIDFHPCNRVMIVTFRNLRNSSHVALHNTRSAPLSSHTAHTRRFHPLEQTTVTAGIHVFLCFVNGS